MHETFKVRANATGDNLEEHFKQFNYKPLIKTSFNQTQQMINIKRVDSQNTDSASLRKQLL